MAKKEQIYKDKIPIFIFLKLKDTFAVEDKKIVKQQI